MSGSTSTAGGAAGSMPGKFSYSGVDPDTARRLFESLFGGAGGGAADFGRPGRGGPTRAFFPTGGQQLQQHVNHDSVFAAADNTQETFNQHPNAMLGPPPMQPRALQNLLKLAGTATHHGIIVNMMFTGHLSLPCRMQHTIPACITAPDSWCPALLLYFFCRWWQPCLKC